MTQRASSEISRADQEGIRNHGRGIGPIGEGGPEAGCGGAQGDDDAGLNPDDLVTKDRSLGRIKPLPD